jgi:hypothetical protein
MALAELYTGQIYASGSEWSCPNNSNRDLTPVPITTDGVYQVFLSCSGLLAGQELQIKIYEKVTTTDAQQLVYQSNLLGPQAPLIWVSPSLILLNGWDVTLKLTAGTGAPGIRYSIRQVA